MATYSVRNSFLGTDTKVEYSDRAIGYALVITRIVMGWVLFQGGITKVLSPVINGEPWTAAGFLNFAIPEGNPFTGFFASIAGSPVIDFLVMWGLTLTGLGLILGALVRWNAFWGAIMMIMFWAASLTGGLAQFLPLEHGWVIDDHLVYAALLFALGAFGAGRYFGLDTIIEKMAFVKNAPWLKYLLG